MKQTKVKSNSGTDEVKSAMPHARAILPIVHIFSYFLIMKKTFYSLLLITVVGVIAYSNTFSVPFQFDDAANIAENPVIQNLDNFFVNSKGYSYNERRYIGYLTFALNYSLDGLDVFGYHLVNLAIHILNAMLIYVLALLTLQLAAGRSQNQEDGTQDKDVHASPLTPHDSGPAPEHSSPVFSFVPLFSALLFVAHPVQTQAVTYIVQRFTSLAAMFYLASVVFYVKGRLFTQRSAGGGPSAAVRQEVGGPRLINNSRFTGRGSRVAISGMFYLLSFVSAVLAMRTKEITFTLPMVIVLYEFIFFKTSFKKKLLFLLPVLLTLVIIPASIIGSDRPLGEILSDLSERTRVQTDIPRGDYLLTQMRVVTTYIRLLFMPVNQNLDYDYPIYSSLLRPEVFLSFVFLSALFGTALYLLNKTKKAAFTIHDSLFTIYYPRLIAFGILWFFITLSVESSFIPITDVIFEHRVYLPSAGAFMALTAAFFLAAERLRERWGNMKMAVIYLLIAAVAALTAATYARNLVWQDEEGMWKDVVSKAPGNARAYNNVGYLLLGKGRTDEAITYFSSAIKRKYLYPDAHTNLGVAYYSKGWFEPAITQFRTALGMSSSDTARADAHHNLGLTYTRKGLLSEALTEFGAALKSAPDNPEIYSDMGVAYKQMGLIGKAVESYEAALSLKPDYAPAHFNLGLIFREQGLKDKAEEHLFKAHKLDPGRF